MVRGHSSNLGLTLVVLNVLYGFFWYYGARCQIWPHRRGCTPEIVDFAMLTITRPTDAQGNPEVDETVS